MSKEQVYLIRKSFSGLERIGAISGLVFYRRLFELDPSLRRLFKDDIEDQSEKLFETLASLIGHLDQTDRSLAELRLMGQRHYEYGVKETHYEIVGQALIDMLAETLRRDFTDEVKEAWLALYSSVSEQMLAGAEEAAALSTNPDSSSEPTAHERVRAALARPSSLETTTG